MTIANTTGKPSNAASAAAGRGRLDVSDLDAEMKAGRVVVQVFDDGSELWTLRGEVIKVVEATE